ncbi:MAG: SDR family NAD(P)-dependent oxidoreductase [Chloroflexi bacterium]|nr:SDR family NAD(P)-dependent oxidoreductase [Chloroflexota bacterium]
MKSFLMITGATGGLGSAFVLEAARRGYDLLLTDQTQEGESFADRLVENYNIRVIYHSCDLTDDGAREKFLYGLKNDGHKFWGLINVAGLDYEGGFLTRNRVQILKILQINILATMDITHGILALRDADQRFRLVNVCSMAGFYPMPYKATYSASKRFLLDFSCALREEIKSFGSVTALCPSGIPTTVECMRSIFAQGFWGLITSINPEDIAHMAMKAALKGRSIVIPGWINRYIHAISTLVPQSLAIKYVAKRWKYVQKKLEDQNNFIQTHSVPCTSLVERN